MWIDYKNTLLNREELSYIELVLGQEKMDVEAREYFGSVQAADFYFLWTLWDIFYKVME